MNKHKIIGIRDMAEFVGRSGSITNQFTLSIRALEGTKLHQAYQSSQGDLYKKEVSIVTTLELYDYEITFQGRMDGLYIENDEVYIEEIKSTSIDLDDIVEATTLAHYNQLMIYGYLYSNMYDLKQIHLNLVYIHVKTKQIKKIYYQYNFDELKDIFMHIFDYYYQFMLLEEQIHQRSIKSISNLEFPYENKRKGQSDMMNAVFYSIKNNSKLFIQASTGLGKTLAVLYPALKAYYKEYTNKIIYLTAKNVTRKVVIESLGLLKEKGLKLNAIIINSKDSMCLLDKRDCNPKVCPYADHYFNKVNDILLEALHEHEYFDDAIILEYARKYSICPFEFSLDISDFCTLMVMDYNYIFEPRIHLVRLDKPELKKTLLVDEAHNLVDRSREMFSASLSYDALLQAKMIIDQKNKKIASILDSIIDEFTQLREKIGKENYLVLSLPPAELIELVSTFFMETFDYLQEVGNEEDEFLEFFYECSKFRFIFELYDSCYMTYVTDGPLMIKLFCIDPTESLINEYIKCQSSILFSATLLPITYFYSVLGGKEQDRKLYFPSSFNNQRRKIFISQDVDTRYRQRKDSIPIITQYIYRFSSQKKGNYLVLFPSYEYMNKVFEIFNETYQMNTYRQSLNMSIQEREEFLKLFENREETNIFFGILGGIFSEGIDFKGDLLIGCIIIGVGLPQIGLERDLIRDYYQEDGYDYSYRYPGFNKVLQGSGRVIRTEEDYGAILLLDQRYLQKEYLKLFPIEWENCQKTTVDTIGNDVKYFWNTIK